MIHIKTIEKSLKERKWLHKLRIEKKMSQQQLANDIGLTQQAIDKIEKGLIRPKPETAQKLAKVLRFNWTIFYVNEVSSKELQRTLKTKTTC